MSVLLVRAALVAVVTAAVLIQLQSESELLVWEILLLAVVIWEMRQIPGGGALDDRPLWDLSPREPARLPRIVSATELSVIDALSGHLAPDRRLQPALARIASHRLARLGVGFDSAAAVHVLGEEEWSWLSNPTEHPPDVELVERIVFRLEEL